MKLPSALALVVTLLLTQCQSKAEETYPYIRSDIPPLLLQMKDVSPLLAASWFKEKDIPNSPSACKGEGISRGFSYLLDSGYVVHHHIYVCPDAISAQRLLYSFSAMPSPFTDMVSEWTIDSSRKPAHADDFSGVCRIRLASEESEANHPPRLATHCEILLRYGDKVSTFFVRYPEKISAAFTEEDALNFLNDQFDKAISAVP